MTQNRRHRLNAEQTDYLIYQLSRIPVLSSPEIQEDFKERYGVELSDDRLYNFKTRNDESIRNYKDNPRLMLELAVEYGHLTLGSIYNRVKHLEEIVEMCTKGYAEEALSTRGEVVSVTKKNPQAAIAALRQIRVEMSDKSTVGSPGTEDMTVTIEEAFPEEDSEN